MSDNNDFRPRYIFVDAEKLSKNIYESSQAQSEIYRLKDALERAEREIDRLDSLSKALASSRSILLENQIILEAERDEASRLACQYYQLWHTAESELLKRVNGEKSVV